MGFGETETRGESRDGADRFRDAGTLFFLDYAPVLIASALTGENVEHSSA